MKVGFIGYGRMGSALAQGAVAAGVLKRSDVVVYELASSSRKQAVRAGFRSAKNLPDLLRKASYIFLCVKPQGMMSLLDDLRGMGKTLSLRSKCFVSIAAGVRLKTLESKLGSDVPVLRVMPNTPALLNAGVSGVCKGRKASRLQAKSVEKILLGVGDVVWTTDSKMDGVTAVSGSGPAYAFYLAEAMIQSARAFGFSKEDARRLVHRTIYGAGLMLEKRKESAEEMRRQVTSPGGTTEAAVRQFDRSRMKSLVGLALKRAAQRSRQLSQKIS